jgi:integrase
MASLQSRNGSWRVLFRHRGQQHTFWLGSVEEQEARATAAKVDYWLMRLKQNLVHLPPRCDVVTFVKHDGRPPEHAISETKGLTLGELRDKYLPSQAKKLEETTLAGIRLHFGHLTRLFGEKRLVSPFTRADLQGYVNKRASEWIDPNIYKKRREKLANARPKRNFTTPRPARVEEPDKPLRHPSATTIRKELVSLRTAWNWARRHLQLIEEFPSGGLDYAKTEESLPFMSWEEAVKRIKAGDDPEQVWECVYLRPEEVASLLTWVKERPVSPWVYSMFCFAAYTGARRSEIVRALPSDVNLDGGVVTVREKKRDKRRRTTRRVPLTPLLKTVLSDWMETRANGRTFFCKDDGGPITPREAHNYFQRGLRLSKWAVLKGWHVFRHSFISALASKGVDQRIIDDIVGHQTDEQRRRYRHLYPDVKERAVLDVFG